LRIADSWDRQAPCRCGPVPATQSSMGTRSPSLFFNGRIGCTSAHSQSWRPLAPDSGSHAYPSDGPPHLCIASPAHHQHRVLAGFPLIHPYHCPHPRFENGRTPHNGSSRGPATEIGMWASTPTVSSHLGHCTVPQRDEFIPLSLKGRVRRTFSRQSSPCDLITPVHGSSERAGFPQCTP
jgi:hypothetical protein